MKKSRNKKGSVLILVVLIIGVLSILGTTVLSAALSNYKMGIASSDLKSNIYLTEAGFDEVYAEIYEIIGESTEKADQAANLQLETFTDDYFNEQVEKQLKFDAENIGEAGDFIVKDPVKDEYIYDQEKIQDKLKEVSTEVFKTEFISKFEEMYFKNDSGTLKKGEYKNLTIPDEIVYMKKDADNYFTSTNLKFDDNLDGTGTLTIYLVSEYSGNTSRNAEVYLDIKTPKYGESYEITNQNLLITENPLWDKIIACDGNLTVSGNSTDVDINGEIYSGTDVNIENGSNFNTSKNVAVVGDFKMLGKNTVSTEDLYVRNILLKGSDIDFSVKGSGELYSGVYLHDDLEMNNTKQDVKINADYYGFNEGSGSESNSPDSSSGVIINSSDINKNNGSSIIFEKGLYVYGTSYINLYGENSYYQTGESVSVKGNYIAYTMPLSSGIYKSDNVEFEYIEPLTLAKKFIGSSNDFTVSQKADYFKEYYDEYNSSGYSGLSLDNIDITGDIYTLGTAISENEVIASTLNNDEEFFRKRANIYNLYTEALGNFDIASMTGGIPEYTVSISPIKAEDFDFTVIDIPEGELYSGSNIKLTVRNSTDTYDLTLNASNPKYEFIITRGDVNISGNGVFNGCIITKGDVNISGRGTLNYNREVVLKCFGKYPEIAEAFKPHALNGDAQKLPFLVSSSLVPPSDSNTSTYTNLDYSSLLHFHNWKIIYN